MEAFENSLNTYWSIEDQYEKDDFLSELQSLYSSIKMINREIYYELKEIILSKIKENKSFDEIASFYDFYPFREVSRLILREYLSQQYLDDFSDNSSDLTNCDMEIIKEEEWEWRDNQLEGILNSVNQNFASGIHIGATGSGKSLMFLNIIKRFNEENPNKNVLITCERKNILKQLFDKGNAEETEKYFNFLKENEIIDFDRFEVLHLYDNKYRKLHFKILTESKQEKPYLIVANRSYLTSFYQDKKRYEQINSDDLGLIILDEMHSASSDENYMMLLYFKQFQTKIQGFSATPFRYGDSGHLQFSFLNDEDNEKYNTTNNLKRLLNIFHQEDNEEKYNIISDFDIKKAIEKDVILEPVYHLVKIPREEFNEHNDYSLEELKIILSNLNEVVGIVPYSKIIIWCQQIKKANDYLETIEELKSEFENLSELNLFIDHSQVKTDYPERVNDYQDFFNLQSNACLICADKHREGSDIPYLTIGVLLDKVKNRSVIPAVQSYGRVLRKDKEGLKKKGHIIEVLIEIDNDEYIEDLYRRLISYFKEFFDFNTLKNKNKVKTISSFKDKLQKDDGKIKIHLGNGKFIEINDVNITEVTWKNILEKCQNYLEEKLEFNEFDKFQLYKEDIKKYRFNSSVEYRDNARKFNLVENPDEYFKLYWKGWYNFLSLSFPELSYEEWKIKIKELNIKTVEDYINSDLPFCPDEIYKEKVEQFNLIVELNKIWKVDGKNRRCK